MATRAAATRDTETTEAPAEAPADEIIWEEPPERTSGASKWVRKLQPLTQRPNQWARIATQKSKGSAASLASQLRNGGLKRPSGAWEFQAHDTLVYAQYLGEDESLAPAPAKRTRKSAEK